MTFAVNTGLDSFLDPEDIGAMYPFVGLEEVLAGVALFLWLAWHFLQARGETREHTEACAMYDAVGMQRVMRQGPGALTAHRAGRLVEPDDSELDAERVDPADPGSRPSPPPPAA